MSEYIKKTWVDGEVITAEKLNNMETGITEAKKAAERSGLAADKVQDNLDKFSGQSAAETQKRDRVVDLTTNGYFPRAINQREVATTSAWHKCLDRWISRSSGIGILIDSDGLHLSSDATGNVFLYQRLDVPDEQMFGKTYTVAVCDGDGNIACKSGTLPTSNPTSWALYANAVVGNVSVGIRHIGTENNGFAVTVGRTSDNTNEAVIRWVALYEGSYTLDTLPTYQPKEYVAELAVCQWYYVLTIGQGYGYTISDKAVRLNIPLPTGMRVTPSIDKSDLTWTVRCNGTVTEITKYEIHSCVGNILRLTLTADSSVFTNGQAVVAYASSPFGVSADI